MAGHSATLIPAEWSPQQHIYTCWPSHPELWPGKLLAEARSELVALAAVLSDHTPCSVLACGEEGISSAQQQLPSAINVTAARFGDIWLRDTGPLYTDTGECLRFRHNGWGGKYLYEFDDEVGDTLATLTKTPIHRFDYVLEGGALEHNGEGAILTTRQCLLNPNRNGWTEQDAGTALKDAFAAGKIYWLDEGLQYDHTDGHIDNLARFINAGTVVCQQAFGKDDPNAGLYEKTARDLQSLGLDIVQVPSPGLVRDGNGDIMPASHMNFIISNDVVVVPVYGTASEEQALYGLSELFPAHKVIGIRANALLTGGGSFHCITQQVPEYGSKK